MVSLVSSPNKTRSRGSVAFTAKMPDHGDQLKMAARLNEKQDQVSRWASGDRKPSIAARAKLETEVQIPWRWWDEPPTPEQEAAAEPVTTFRDPPAATGTHGVG